MGVVSLGLDVFTLGIATTAVQGTKAGFKLANAFSKVILTDVASDAKRSLHPKQC